jgi:sialate O-acetylesterase
MTRPLWAAALLGVAVLISPARANVTPNPLFGNGMVLQQGIKCPVWGKAEVGEEVRVTFKGDGDGIEEKATTGTDGKWRVELPPQKAGGPYTLTIEGKNKIPLRDVFVGEVWVCSGQSNMEWAVKDSAGGKEAIPASKNPKIRLFTVNHKVVDKPVETVDLFPPAQKGVWLECGPTTVGGFSAVAYQFGKHLQEKRNVPIGLIHTSWGGTVAEAWTPREALEANPDLKHLLPKTLQQGNQNQGTVLYNGMIAPVIPFAIKGAIWYQGESNADRAYEYRTLFPTMIKSWREAWKQGEFPFLFVQLASFKKQEWRPTEAAWPELRDAQLFTSQTVPNTAMAVITDVGDNEDIHPKDKTTVGIRLALAARALAYEEKIEYSGPVFKSMNVENHRAVLTFTHLGKGLDDSAGTALIGFTIAGEDRKFYNAHAEIQKDKVVVWTDKVTKPVAVRYGWANYPLIDLWNKDGLPASPFRTDDFPGVTGPKKK